MKLSLEQAETKICPAVQGGTCVADLCAAWRWSRAKETQAFLDAVQSRMLVEGENFGKASQAVWAEQAGSFEQVEGYCGLGGKPE